MQRLCVIAVLCAVGLALAAAPGAVAAAPAPTPVGDDVGFVSFGALAERVSVAAYTQALHIPGFSRRERSALSAARRARQRQADLLDAPLGGDAPRSDDFHIVVPATTKVAVLKAILGLDRALTSVYAYGTSQAQDPATRLLLARLLAGDAQFLSQDRVMAGLSPHAGLPAPLDVDAAGSVLDPYLQSVGTPQEITS